MKKIIPLLLLAVLCLAFTACKEKSRDVRDTEIMIKAIGTVTDQSGEDIEFAERFYRGLSEEEKQEVANYDVLVEARTVYNQLIMYGEWCQFTTNRQDTFTLNPDGTFKKADGTEGTYEVIDSQVVLTASDGKQFVYRKYVNKNLLHLIGETEDYIRPDLLVVKKEIMLTSEWSRFFDVVHHIHVQMDKWGFSADYWNSISVVPKEKYAGLLAPETNATITLNYTSRDIATFYKLADGTLSVIEEMTEPVRQTVTVQVTGDMFSKEDKCFAESVELVRGSTSDYGDGKTVYRVLDYFDFENMEVPSFEGEVYSYYQLMD